VGNVYNYVALTDGGLFAEEPRCETP
jgi:hypothetical protein